MDIQIDKIDKERQKERKKKEGELFRKHILAAIV